jgi:ABC-type glycerol-3-phosphate transport system substrate-binding protein
MGSTYAETIFAAMFNTKWYDPLKDELQLTNYEEAAEWVKRIYEVTPRAQQAAMKLPTWSAGLASGKLAMQINGSWTSGELISQHKSKSNYGVTWVPSSPGDHATAALPWGLGIPITSEHPELAYSLMDYLGSAEAQQVMFDGLGWLNVNLKSLPRVNVGADPLVKDAINMFIKADRVAAPPPLLTLMDVRNQIRGTLYSIWDGKVASRAALEDLNNRMNRALNEAKSH